MKVIKPLTQSLLHRKFDYDNKSFLSVISAVYFDFKTQKLCSEQDLWKHFGEECLTKFNAEMLDMIGKKKTPEVVVNGYAYGKYAKEGKTTVQLKLNNVSKTLEVYGDRYWINGKPSAPEAFDKIPINWANTYGGEGYALNPRGKGRDYIVVGNDQVMYKPVPNVEHPAYPIRKEGEEYPAVTLATLPIEYPDRNKLMGTYDERWRREEFPGLARDVDWSYFNFSPEDQRLTHLHPGNKAVFINMHPEQPECTMTIPHLTSRVFVRFVKDKDKPNEFLHPIDLSLTTLWAFPHLDKAFLLYEGVLELPRWYFVDDIVGELMGAIEHSNRPQSLSYYEEIFRLRTDDKKSMHYAMLDKQLVDEEFLSKSQRIPLSLSLKQKLKRLIKELRPIEQKQQENKTKIDQLKQDERYNDIDEVDIKTILQETFGVDVKSLDDAEKWLEEGIDLEKENQKFLEEELNEKSTLEQAREFKQEMKKISTKHEETDQDRKKMTRAEFVKVHKEHQDFVKQSRQEDNQHTPENLARAESILKELAEDQQTAKLFYGYTPEQFLDFQASGAVFPSKNFYQLNEKEEMSSEHYKSFIDYDCHKATFLEKSKNIPMKMPAGFFADEEIVEQREIDSLSFFTESTDEVFCEGVSFILTHTATEKHDYQGAAIFNVHAQGSQFMHCDFSNAQLESVSFKQCEFKYCRFISTQFEEAQFEDCQFIHCEFVNAVFDKISLSEINLSQCRLKLATFSSGWLRQVLFQNSKFEMVDFVRVRVWGVKWNACQLKQFGITMGSVKDISFNESTIESMSIIVDSLIDKFVLTQCQLSKVFTKAKTRIHHLSIENSTDKESSWRELVVEGAFFYQVKMENVDFSKTRFEESEFRNCSFRDSLWMGTIAHQAKFANVDFAEAVMMGFQSLGSYFKHTSFFAAELSYVDIDAQTIFDDCYMERANTVPSLRK